MAEEAKQQCAVDPKSLTIKIACSGKKPLLVSSSTPDSLPSPSPYNSPSLISPPSSAFVSALQSPYISPRATLPANPTPSPPVSYCGSQSDDVPSTSYTPPPEPERYDFSDDPMLKIVTGPDTDPRISFSFPVPRISFAKGSISPANSNAKLRSCDVYIGYHGQNPNLGRFCKWLKSELELQGIAAFVADRAKYVSDNQSHEIADRIICSVTFGIVVITNHSLFNHTTVEEVRFFAQKKNLIPLFFSTDATEIASLSHRLANPPHSQNKKFKEALDAVFKCHEYKLEAKEGNWRSCVSKAAGILRAKLGRTSVAEKNPEVLEELPFPRNKHFVGREKEIMEIEAAFFGCGDNSFEQENGIQSQSQLQTVKAGGTTAGQSEGLADDDESEIDGVCRGKYINLEVGRCKDSNGETWVEGRNSVKRSKYKKSKSCKDKSFGSSVVCISGLPGGGKTELALEFAHRYWQRYKMVLWVGGEARYFRQNILNISVNLGLDVSADAEKERGRRIRSFDEQESEAFKRVRREIFRDMPYLLIIDNLETEKEWWEGKDLHDLIPSNTGGTHVIITTRISRVMNMDPLQLHPLPVSDAMALIQGRQKRQYPVGEEEFIHKFNERLRSSSFGVSVVGSLLTELAIPPSVLFEAVNQVPLEDNDDTPTHSNLTIAEEQLCRSNPFLMKTLAFSAAVLQQSKNLLASRMLQVGAWLAPTPISVNILAAAANRIPDCRSRLRKWTKCMKLALFCCTGHCLGNQTWKSEEEEAAFLLVRMGLARKSNRQPGCWIQLHPITQVFAKRKDGLALAAAKATVQGVRRMGNPHTDSDHFWATAFLVFGFKSEPPNVQLNATEMVLFIRKTALPLAINAFTTFSRCNSALELLKVCTNVLEEVEKSFVSQIQDWHHASLCWKKTTLLQSNQRVDEYVWQEVTLLKATLLETRAKLLLRGGHFDSGEELCRTCISIRTVMLGHNHAHTLAAQQTLAKLVRMRSKI